MEASRPLIAPLVLAVLVLAQGVGRRADAAVLPATPDTLARVVAGASPGDVVTLTGSGGDVTLKDVNFAGRVTVTSAGRSRHASLRSLAVVGSSNLLFDGVDIAFTPDEKTASFSPGVLIKASHDVVFRNARVVGGVAVNGVPQDALHLDATGNVLGVPTGYGINVSNSQRVTVQGVEVTMFDRGILVGGSTDVAVLDNHVHDTRRTAIVGAGLQRLLVARNHIHDIHPWRLGQTPLGDHGDFMAFWTDPKILGPTEGLVITDNLMEQGNGAQVLGVWIQGQTQGFIAPEFSRNVVLNGNNQGFTAKDVKGPIIRDNVFLQTTGDSKQTPSILLTGSTSGAQITGNTTGGVSDATPAKDNVIDERANKIIRREVASPAALDQARRRAPVPDLRR